MTGKMRTGIVLSIMVVLIIIGAAYLQHAAFLSPPVKPYSGPVENITISVLPIYTPGLIIIGYNQGYFRDNGLDVTLKIFATGPMGIEQIKAGQVDIAYVSDFVLVEKIFAGSEDLRCLSSIAAADINQVIARKDKGILQPGDLRGKRIGVPRGTIAEFFLGRFLTFYNLSLSDVKISNLSPHDIVESLANDKVDAVMVWEPVTYDIKRLMGDKIISWPGQSGQKFYNVLVSTKEFIKTRPGALERLFQALDQAETFMKGHQEESIDIIAKQIKIDQSIFKTDWRKNKYGLSLDQSLLLSMEDEGRWMINNGLSDKKTLPNYLNYIYAGPLKKVKPKAVTMIIPKPKGPDNLNNLIK